MVAVKSRACRIPKQGAVVKRQHNSIALVGMSVKCRKATLREDGIAVAHSGDLGKLWETSAFY